MGIVLVDGSRVGCKVFTLQDNSHEAIIDPETFEMVQRELAIRTQWYHSGTVYL